MAAQQLLGNSKPSIMFRSVPVVFCNLCLALAILFEGVLVLELQCKRAKRSLSASIQATTEIDSLFDDIDCSCSIYHARFEELNVGCFGYSVGPVKKTSRDSGIDKKNLHEVIIEKDSAGCWARRPSRTISRRQPRNKTRSTRTCKQPLRRSLQRQQRRAPSHQLGQAKDALHQV